MLLGISRIYAHACYYLPNSQDVLSFFAQVIKNTHTIPLYLGSQGWLVGVSSHDVGAAAASLAMRADWAHSDISGHTFTLTSTEKLTGQGIASAFSEVLGSEYYYAPHHSREETVKSFTSLGMPEWQAQGMADQFEAFAIGKGTAPTHDLQSLLSNGQTPMGLREVIIAKGKQLFM